MGGVVQLGGASWPVGVGAGQMGGTMSSSQYGQMGGEEWRGAGVGGTSQGLVGASQMCGERQGSGMGGVGQLGGVSDSWPFGVRAGHMVGRTSSSHIALADWQMGGQHPGGVGCAGWYGEATRPAKGVVEVGQMGGTS